MFRLLFLFLCLWCPFECIKWKNRKFSSCWCSQATSTPCSLRAITTGILQPTRSLSNRTSFQLFFTRRSSSLHSNEDPIRLRDRKSSLAASAILAANQRRLMSVRRMFERPVGQTILPQLLSCSPHSTYIRSQFNPH